MKFNSIKNDTEFKRVKLQSHFITDKQCFLNLKKKPKCDRFLLKIIIPVPDRVYFINDYTEEELKQICIDLNMSSDVTRWWEQETLKHLDLSSNSIACISPKISCLLDLHTLHVSIKFNTFYGKNQIAIFLKN